MTKKIDVLKKDGNLMSLSLIIGNGDKNRSKIVWFLNDSDSKGAVEANDYFDCLVEIRKIFERDDLRILCNGCRYDVYPSRMSRQMGRGMKAYIMVLGKQATESDLVGVFDSTDSSRVKTVEDQKEYYTAWLNSLR
jgi:hypothetical protein